MDKYAREMSLKHIAGLETIIKENMPEGMVLDVSRLTKRVYQDGIEHYCFDGTPFLEVHPVTVNTKKDGDSIKLVSTFKYRKLP